MRVPQSKRYGHQVRLMTYVSPEVYEALRQAVHAEPRERWESNALRRIIKEWLAQRGDI